MSGCLLCLVVNEVGIAADSDQWRELNIKNVIEKHLWPLSSIESGSWVCNTCWQKLYDFHQYYKHIEKVHTRTVLITNITQDKKRSGTLSVKEAIEEQEINIPERMTRFGENSILPFNMSIEEPEIHIKAEIPDDDMPLLERYKQEKSHKRAGDPLKNSINSKCIQGPKICEIGLESAANVKTFVDIKKEPSLTNDSDESIDHLINESDSNGKTDDLNLSISCSQRYDKPETNSEEYDNFIARHFKITCDLCHIRLETFHVLRKHFEIEHKKTWGYVICCGNKYYSRGIFVDHLNRHLDPNYFKCELCGKSLASRRCLELHRKKHLEKREKTHCCDICGTGFLTFTELTKHKLIHLPNEENHFSCSDCGKNFDSKHLMSHHYRAVHLNKYAKSCDICGMSLQNRDDLERHMLEHEGKTKPLRGLKRHKDMINSKLTCSICGKILPNSKALKRHIQYKHEMGHDYKCIVCDKTFKIAQIFKEHMASHWLCIT